MKLYRYRSMASEGLSRTFTHCELYFASPSQLNDPFDCNPPFSTTEYTDDDLREHYRIALSEYHKLVGLELTKQIDRHVSHIKENNCFSSMVIEPAYKACIEVNSDLGILCLSEKYDDILMWSHYANGHTGNMRKNGDLL